MRKKRDYFTKKGNKPMTKKRWKNKQFFFLLEIDEKMQVGNVFELCKHMEYKQIICCTVNKWTILKGLTIEVHDIFNRC